MTDMGKIKTAAMLVVFYPVFFVAVIGRTKNGRREIVPKREVKGSLFLVHIKR